MPVKLIERKWNLAWAATMVAVASLLSVALHADDVDFVTAVVATRPVAYYRLDSTSGKSEVGATQYKSSGGVSVAASGAPTGNANNRSAQFDGRDGYIVTTQSGGVGETASMMAWVNLAGLPADARHFYYVMGESQDGNDLDLQFENDNVLKFYTAAGGHLSYAPPPSSLVNQWHLIVVTLDTASHTRALYWDGKSVATDKGGGRAGKTGILSIGASTVFGGRFFQGGIAEVALWNRALKPTEVAAIYTASKSAAAAPGGGAKTSTSASRTGPFATTAKVTADDSNGPIALKREEQIALMFLTAIQDLEFDCQMRAKHPCTLDQLLTGTVAADGSHIGRLKFDPKTDPNYTYTLGASTSGMAWEAHANPKKPGLAGFYFMSKGNPGADAFYNPSGTAAIIDKELMGRGVEGDSFAAR
ncbi:MAG: LamG domain-containing protein [Terriglobales bacterium]